MIRSRYGPVARPAPTGEQQVATPVYTAGAPGAIRPVPVRGLRSFDGERGEHAALRYPVPMWPLLGIAVLAVGFAVRLNPLLVVLAAALASGIAAGIPPLRIMAALGKAYNDSRYVSIVWLVLPVIGLLEREGLQERARMLVARVSAATTGRLLLVYLGLRQITAALGLTSFGGHAQMVRPLIAPMAEGAAEARLGGLSPRLRHVIRAHAAAADNVGAFFGEDIFIAVGSVLLIKAALEQSGFHIAPLRLSLWAIPTALLAFVLHGVRLWRLDARLARLAQDGEGR